MHRTTILVAATLALVIALAPATVAHKPITSKYTYHQDVFPVFEAKCSGCHAPDAVAPMSLLTYEDAYPWAQSIKEELVNLSMPPWQAESGFGAFKHGGSLTAKELDIVVEWSNGGTPEGQPVDRPPSGGAGNDDDDDDDVENAGWSLGQPSVVLTMPVAYTLAADTLEATRYFVIPSSFARDTSIRAVDVRPGASAIVRSVIVYVDSTGEAAALDAEDPEPGFAAPAGFATEQILAAWVPGQRAVALDAAAFRVPADADLIVRIAYKKTWTYEGLAVEDRTALGLYVWEQTVPTIEAMALQPSAGVVADATGHLRFTHDLTRDVELLALVPDIAPGALAVQILAVGADGQRTPIIRLASPRPEWRTRYWLESPLTLSSGTTLEVQALFTEPPSSADPPVRFLLDLVASGTSAAEAAPDALP